MNELVRYLLDNIFIDFQGAVELSKIREFLSKDNSKEARALLGKLSGEESVDDMLDTLGDVLKPYVFKGGITDAVMRQQIAEFTDS